MQTWTMTLHPQNIVRYTRSYKNNLCLLLQNINNNLNAACNNQWSGTASAENPSLTIRLGLWRVRSMRPIAHLESSQGDVENYDGITILLNLLIPLERGILLTSVSINALKQIKVLVNKLVSMSSVECIVQLPNPECAKHCYCALDSKLFAPPLAGVDNSHISVESQPFKSNNHWSCLFVYPLLLMCPVWTIFTEVEWLSL